MCVNACIYAYFHVCGCMCVPKVNVRYLSRLLSTLLTEAGSLAEPQSFSYLVVLASKLIMQIPYSG